MLWYTPDDILKYKDNIRDGDILMYHKRDAWWRILGARLIQFGTQGPFNHSDIVYHKDNVLRVIMADSVKGVVDRPWVNVYKNTPHYIMVLRPTVKENGKKYTKTTGKKVVQNAKQYIGQMYDYFATIVFFFKMLGFGMFNGWNPFNWSKGWFCSENVVQVERDSGVMLCPDYTPSSVSPNQLFIDPENKLDVIRIEDNTTVYSGLKDYLYQLNNKKLVQYLNSELKQLT